MILKNEYIRLKSEQRLHQCNVPIVALTGGIATGKSTASEYLKKKNFNVICADQLIKRIYQQDETIDFIKRQFPNSFTNGEINFKQLRKEAFSDEKNRTMLETFLYQKLPHEFLSSINDRDQVVVYDVPLLYEKNLAPRVDYSLLIYAPQNVQIDRLIKRDRIDEALANEILSQQLSIEDKKSRADYVIENTGTIQALEERLEIWVSSLFE